MLIKCVECGKEISDKAEACPNCGCPVEKINSTANNKNKTNKLTDKVISIGFFIIIIMVFIVIVVNSNVDTDNEIKSNTDSMSEIVQEIDESAIDIMKITFNSRYTSKLNSVIIGNAKNEIINMIETDFLKRSSYNLNIISSEKMTEELLQRFKNKYPNDVNWEQYSFGDMNVYDIQALSNDEKVWNTFEAYVITINTDKGERILTISNKLLYEDFKTKSEVIPFDSYARNTNKYVGKRIVFEGEVIQTLYEGNYCEMRINVTKGEYGFYTDTIYAFYNLQDGEDKFLDGDIIKAYGTIIGENSYISVLGSGVQLPLIEIKSMELVK